MSDVSMSEEEVAKSLDETYMVRVLSVSPDRKPHICSPLICCFRQLQTMRNVRTKQAFTIVLTLVNNE